MPVTTFFENAIFLSAAAIFAPLASAQPQVRAVPPPVMSNPSGPQADVESPQKPDQFTTLTFRVSTGDDDLRSDSSAWVFLTYPGGQTQSCELRGVGGDTWPNNSTREAPLCFMASPKTYDELKLTKMSLAYNGHPGQGDVGLQTFAHNMDNWNVNSVRIEAKNILSHTRRCLIDMKGRPLVRMTKSLDRYDLKQNSSGC